MNNSFRKKLYNRTKPEHMAVEHVFNFRNAITIENLTLFYRTILIARSCCREDLQALQNKTGYELYNAALIDELKKDIDITDAELNKEVAKFNGEILVTSTLSAQLGMFYVFAGSSSGAKVIFSMIKNKKLTIPTHYFSLLEAKTSDQMAVLGELLDREKFKEADVVTAAKQTFNLIHKIASNGF